MPKTKTSTPAFSSRAMRVARLKVFGKVEITSANLQQIPNTAQTGHLFNWLKMSGPENAALHRSAAEYIYLR